MRKRAIKEKDLNDLIAKYRRGDFVLWDGLKKEAEGKLYSFDGVGKRRTLPPPRKKKPTRKERYVRTKEEVAKYIGVTRTTLHRWETAKLITMKKISRYQAPSWLLREFHFCWVYDAEDIRKQAEKIPT